MGVIHLAAQRLRTRVTDAMALYPFKDADAKTGSNVRGNVLDAHRAQQRAAYEAYHGKRVRAERKALATLFTQSQLRALAKIGAAVRVELREEHVPVDAAAEDLHREVGARRGVGRRCAQRVGRCHTLSVGTAEAACAWHGRRVPAGLSRNAPRRHAAADR